MSIPEIVIQTRKDQGLTLKAFGAALGVTKQSIYHWQTGVHAPDVTFLIITAARYSDWRHEWAHRCLAVIRPELFSSQPADQQAANQPAA